MDHRGCQEHNELTRRQFLGTSMTAGAFGMLGLLNPQLLYAARGPLATSKHVILLFMDGGQSHLDTWDPKPGQATGGPTKAIDTAVKGIRVSEHLPRLAERFEDLSLIRSLTSKEGSHERAQYLMHTGYKPMGSIAHSTLGSTVWKMKGAINKDLPAYVHVGPRRWPAGHLGSDYAAYHITTPQRATDNISYYHGVNSGRFERRLELLRDLDESFAKKHSKADVLKAYAAYYNAAHAMMKSASAAAFDLDQETPAMRSRYGNNFFGQGCLLARRLVNAGVRFVEVSLGGWDTHQNNFERVAELSATLDQATSALIDDLRRLELLDSTLILLCSEFGRTPQINGNDGRDHWPRVWSAMLGGGGIQGGRVIGESTDGGEEVKDRPVQVGELHATLCKCLDINPATINYAPDGRIVRIVENTAHRPLMDLF